jgi:C1A family cysteine protease
VFDHRGLKNYKETSNKFEPDNHSVLCSGWGETETGQKYWLIKNSWGIKWGINGFLQLKRGANKCGINLWATTDKWRTNSLGF